MKKSYVVLFHIVFWLPRLFQPFTYLYVFSMLRGHSVKSIGAGGNSFDESLFYAFNSINSGIALFAEILIFYTFYLYLFPRYIDNQKIKRFLVVGLGIITGVTVLNPIAQNILAGYYAPVAHFINLSQKGLYKFFTDSTLFLKLGAVGITACLLRGFIAWYNDIRYKKELENRNLQTELALLKAQINPHFLFNTLNNIDILIEKDAATASVYLQKLSDLLRFTLYESPAETIPLTREISGIEQYIDLQKIRSANADFVKFEIHGSTDELFIAPMIFMPFVENAFKHSTNKKMDGAISIRIDVNESEINFTCINVFDETNALIQANSGLGLELMNNRLNLFYRGNHTLNIEKTENLFTVNLMIRADAN